MQVMFPRLQQVQDKEKTYKTGHSGDRSVRNSTVQNHNHARSTEVQKSGNTRRFL